MQHNLHLRIDEDITYIDYFLQRQRQIDRAIIERMRANQCYSQVWGFTVPACPMERVVEGSISEVDDA